MEDGVGDGGLFGFIGFEDEEKALVVGCGEGGKCGYFLEWLIIFDVGEFKGTDEGGESFGTEAKGFLFYECEVFEMLEEGGWCFGDDMKDFHPSFEVFDKSF